MVAWIIFFLGYGVFMLCSHIEAKKVSRYDKDCCASTPTHATCHDHNSNTFTLLICLFYNILPKLVFWEYSGAKPGLFPRLWEGFALLTALELVNRLQQGSGGYQWWTLTLKGLNAVWKLLTKARSVMHDCHSRIHMILETCDIQPDTEESLLYLHTDGWQIQRKPYIKCPNNTITQKVIWSEFRSECLTPTVRGPLLCYTVGALCWYG